MYPKIIKKYIFYIPIRTIHTYIHLYTALNCYHMKSICSLIHAKLQYITFPSLPQKELRHIKQIYGWTFLMQMHTKQKNRKCTHSYQQRDSLFYDSGTAFFFPSKVITATYCIILWRKVSHAYSLTCDSDSSNSSSTVLLQNKNCHGCLVHNTLFPASLNTMMNCQYSRHTHKCSHTSLATIT